MNENAKMVLVWRHDLNCRKGKFGAQMAHGSIAWLLERCRLEKPKFSSEEKEWMYNGQTKICLRVENEKELLEIYQKAKEKGLTTFLITDAGHTEFNGPTKTVVAIGPNDSKLINSITGHLKLM